MRCSKLPLFFKCAPSGQPVIGVSEWNPEGTLGTAAHACAARIVRSLPVDVQAVAEFYDVDPATLGFLVSRIHQAWGQIRPPVDVPVFAEIELAMTVGNVCGLLLTGTADALWLAADGKTVRVVDFKTGRVDSDYRDQVMGYGRLALDAYPDAEAADVEVVWLRELETERYTLKRADVPEWDQRYEKQAFDETFRPGDHCRHCPRQYECQARRKMNEASLALLSDTTRVLSELPDDTLIRLRRRAKDVRDLAEHVEMQVKFLTEQRGGLKGEGVRLELVEQERRELKVREAWPVLQRHATDDVLADAVTVSLSKFEDAVGRAAGRGNGKAAKESLNAELEQAGAIERKTIKVIRERRGDGNAKPE